MSDAATAAAAPNPHLAQYAAKGLKGRILSGVQPTGNLHLGNYLGAIRNFARLQNDYECLYCVVDMHAITVWQDPAQMVPQTREIAAAFLAAGVDGRKQIIFNQSMVPEHAQLAWIFNCVARMGWMSRMTQFKEKAGKDRENVSLGLFAYPALMAADILIYKATHVPVGEDQKQHLELTRDIAIKFNLTYGETLVVPEAEMVTALVEEAERIVVDKLLRSPGPSDTASYGMFDRLYREREDSLRTIDDADAATVDSISRLHASYDTFGRSLLNGIGTSADTAALRATEARIAAADAAVDARLSGGVGSPPSVAVEVPAVVAARVDPPPQPATRSAATPSAVTGRKVR